MLARLSGVLAVEDNTNCGQRAIRHRRRRYRQDRGLSVWLHGGMTDGDSPPNGTDEHEHLTATAGTEMVKELSQLIDGWLERIAELLTQGVDPEPLLHGLAEVMRSAADKMDPSTAERSG